MRETETQKRIMVAASERGMTIFRNNVGVAVYPDGSRVAYGLCPGSSDLIGWTPRKIRKEDVGKTIAQFTAIEVKRLREKPKKHQKHFIDQVNSSGGCAFVARSKEDLEKGQKW